LWETILQHRAQLEGAGFFAQRRKLQALDWMRELIALGLEDLFQRDRQIADRLPGVEHDVAHGRMSALAAAQQLLGYFSKKER
jgi:LAO/AO transport system kinase